MDTDTSRSQRFLITWALLGVAIVAAFGIGGFVQGGFSWGVVSVRPAPSVTVSGFARQSEQNQIAFYTAGVTATDPDKELVVSQVNSNMADIIAQLESFGIDKADIQTQNLSIYKMERPPFDDAARSLMPIELPDATNPETEGVWQANNSLEITLRDVNRASELADLLASTNATNVYGPRFSLDEREQSEQALLDAAIQNAREKAVSIAAASGRQLGSVEQVVEGGSGGGVYPLFARGEAVGLGGGDGAQLEPGTTEVTKTVTVTFQLQ